MQNVTNIRYEKQTRVLITTAIKRVNKRGSGRETLKTSWAEQLHNDESCFFEANMPKGVQKMKGTREREEQTKNAHRVKEKIKSLIVFDIDELC